MMNPKQKIIEVVFGPLITVFETKLKLSGFFVAFVFIAIIAIPVFKTKNKTHIGILRKIVIILALFIGLVFGIIDTLKIRNVIQ